MDAHLYKAGRLPPRLRKELEQSPDFEDLMLLEECDAGGRVPGAVVCSVDEALEFLRQTERENEG